MGQVLYRKYRSKSLDEIVGQEHITTTLKNALKSGAISHAYLFTGPRGVGKTSIARILAHELNEIPYNTEDTHLDIIEIDAASNRGIDEIRDLREKVTVAPAQGKYKVYIIDEVHMLTTPAFNALLKTLEEPPAHVVFILATTEVHKLPETIVSRTQRYTFRPVEKDKVVKHLQNIAKQEKVKTDTEALEMIADHGEGSFRDSISLLNQAVGHSDHITVETVQDILGIPPETAIANLFASISDGDKAALLQQLSELYKQGYQAGMVAKQLGHLCRQAVLDGSLAKLDESSILELMASLINVPTSPAPERLLEIVLLQATPQISSHITPASTSTPKLVTATPIKSITTPASTAKQAIKAAPAPTEEVIANKPSASSKKQAAIVAFELDAVWPQLLASVKTQHNTVYGILRMAVPELTDEALVLTFKYTFHQKRMQEPKHRKIIGDAVQALTGQPVTIECRYDTTVAERKPLGTEETELVTPLTPQSSSTPLSTISNIFGGGELLES